MTEKKKVDVVSLRAQLSVLEKAGIRLYLNGRPSNTEYILKNCVNEAATYMPDYITDENGNIKEVRYDRISEK